MRAGYLHLNPIRAVLLANHPVGRTRMRMLIFHAMRLGHKRSLAPPNLAEFKSGAWANCEQERGAVIRTTGIIVVVLAVILTVGGIIGYAISLH